MNESMTELRPNVSVLSINVNGPYSPIFKKKLQLDLPSKNQLYAVSKIKLFLNKILENRI